MRSPGLESPLGPHVTYCKASVCKLGIVVPRVECVSPPRGTYGKQALPASCWVGKPRGAQGVKSLSKFAQLGGGGGWT